MSIFTRVVSISYLILVVPLVFTACGGAAASGGGGSSEAGEDAAPVDPKVGEAKTRCEQEIAKSVNQPGDQLSRIQIHACMYQLKPEIAKCSKGVKREVVLKVIIDKTGDVANVFPVGDMADCPEAKCVAEVVTSTKFPAFKAQTQQTLKYPFTVPE